MIFWDCVSTAFTLSSVTRTGWSDSTLQQEEDEGAEPQAPRPPCTAACLGRPRPWCLSANLLGIRAAWVPWPHPRLRQAPPTTKASQPVHDFDSRTGMARCGGAASWSVARSGPRAPRQRQVLGLASHRGQRASGGAWPCAASWRPASDSGPLTPSLCHQGRATP